LNQYLLLKAAQVQIAIPILAVREILEPPVLTPVPNSPEWFTGLCNLRGHVLPVIHLAARLKLEKRDTARPVLVVVDLETKQGVKQRGLFVDELGGIVDASPDTTRSYDAVGVQIARAFVAGLLPIEPEFALILDLMQIFSSTDLK